MESPTPNKKKNPKNKGRKPGKTSAIGLTKWIKFEGDQENEIKWLLAIG